MLMLSVRYTGYTRTHLVHKVLEAAVLDEDNVVVDLDEDGVQVCEDLVKSTAVGLAAEGDLLHMGRVPGREQVGAT